MRGWMALVLCVMLLAGVGAAESVVATNFPCFDLARQVAGDAAEVKMLLRPGAEAHSYEPSPADILGIADASLFVYIGGESDVWVDGILESLGGDAPRSVRLFDCVSPLQEEDPEGHEREIELDEHIWTSPKNAMAMLRSVEAAMCEAMPERAERFHANADAYYGKIAAVDEALTALAASAKRGKVVFADRFPFLYMTHDYGIGYEAAFASCSAETEPSAQTLVRLIRAIREDGIPCVYTIELSTGTIAEMLAEETGVKILTLHSAQTVSQEEFDAGESYVSLMERNLKALEEGLN